MYGLDLYGVHQSIHEISSYMQRLDPRAAKKIRERYSFFFNKRNVNDEEHELSKGILGIIFIERNLILQRKKGV